MKHGIPQLYHHEIFQSNILLHPSIFYIRFILSLGSQGSAAAYSSCVKAKAGWHQSVSLLQGVFPCFQKSRNQNKQNLKCVYPIDHFGNTRHLTNTSSVFSDACKLNVFKANKFNLRVRKFFQTWEQKRVCISSQSVQVSFGNVFSALNDPCDQRDYNTEAASEWNRQCHISPSEAWPLGRTSFSLLRWALVYQCNWGR